MGALAEVAADRRDYNAWRVAERRDHADREGARLKQDVNSWRRKAWKLAASRIEDATGRHLFPGRFHYFEGAYNGVSYTEVSAEFEGELEFAMRVYWRQGGRTDGLEVRPIEFAERVEAGDFVKLRSEPRLELGRLLIEWGLA